VSTLKVEVSNQASVGVESRQPILTGSPHHFRTTQSGDLKIKSHCNNFT